MEGAYLPETESTFMGREYADFSKRLEHFMYLIGMMERVTPWECGGCVGGGGVHPESHIMGVS